MNAKRKDSKPKRQSLFKGVVDLAFFLGWIFSTGLGGYFLGASSPNATPATPCPEVLAQAAPHIMTAPSAADCSSYFMPASATGGSTSSWDDIKSSWACSKAKYNGSDTHIIPDVDLKQTKWKNVIAASPDAFFAKYLTQYPGDMAVTQPVIIFSHAQVSTLDDVSKHCKVLDVAIVPDKPGMCVAVTETFHDVASYHMLHAKRDETGELSLTPNSVRGRNLPSEESYAVGRALLLDYFTHAQAVIGAVKLMTNQGAMTNSKTKPLVVGCLVESKEEVLLFKNSLQSYKQSGGSMDHIFVVSRFTELHDDLRGSGAKNVWILKTKDVGRKVTDRGTIVEGRRHHPILFSTHMLPLSSDLSLIIG
jgi:hypothetical protein